MALSGARLRIVNTTISRTDQMMYSLLSKLFILTALTVTITACGGAQSNNSPASSTDQFTSNDDTNTGTTPNDNADTIAPTIVSSSPSNGAVDVGLSQEIEITFSENIRSASLNAGLSNGLGEDINAEFSYQGTKLTISPLSSLDYNTIYVVEVAAGLTDLNGNATNSKLEILFRTGIETAQPLQILSNPESVTISTGDDAELSITASSSDTIHYQWYKNDQAISGATEPSLHIEAATEQDSANYKVALNDGITTLYSSSASITVLAAFEITEHPLSQTTSSGQNVTFSVSTEGSLSLSYQWYKNNDAISGATSASYTITSATQSSSADYHVRVSNGLTTVTSETAHLEVVAGLEITENPVPVIIYSNNTATLSVSAQSGLPISYQWYKGGNAIAGSNSNTLSISNAQISDSGSYQVSLSDGNTTLSTTTSITILQSAYINSSPSSQDITEGQSTTLQVDAAGAQPLSYQWYKDGIAITNANSASYSLSNAAVEDSGFFTVRVSNGGGDVYSSAAFIDVIEPTPPTPLIADIALSWSETTLRSDGSFMQPSEISGYVLSYGYSPSMENTITVTDAEHVINNVESGTIYYAVATIDSDGLRGPFTPTFTATIP